MTLQDRTLWRVIRGSQVTLLVFKPDVHTHKADDVTGGSEKLQLVPDQLDLTRFVTGEWVVIATAV